MDVIPAIDLLGGRCVRLQQGDFGRVTEYDRDPVALATAWQAAGATRLHVVDLDGARSGQPANLDVVRRLAALPGLRVQAGGGVRHLETARGLIGSGADRVVIGSVAVKDPAAVLGWAGELGAERFVVAIDVRVEGGGAEPVAVIHGWQDSSGQGLWGLLEVYLGNGVRDFLCTDVGRDGMLSGPNTGLYAECVRRFPGVRLIASGGVSSAADLASLARTGVAGVVTGKALLDGRIGPAEIGRFSRAG